MRVLDHVAGSVAVVAVERVVQAEPVAWHAQDGLSGSTSHVCAPMQLLEKNPVQRLLCFIVCSGTWNRAAGILLSTAHGCDRERTDFVHANDAEVEGVLAGHRRAAWHRAVVEVHGVVGGEIDRVPRIIAAG